MVAFSPDQTNLKVFYQGWIHNLVVFEVKISIVNQHPYSFFIAKSISSQNSVGVVRVFVSAGIWTAIPPCARVVFPERVVCLVTIVIFY